MVNTKTYKLLDKKGKTVTRKRPGKFAGITTTMIFGTLLCGSGKRAKKENRVFFASWNDARANGFRPCKNCKPRP